MDYTHLDRWKYEKNPVENMQFHRGILLMKCYISNKEKSKSALKKQFNDAGKIVIFIFDFCLSMD